MIDVNDAIEHAERVAEHELTPEQKDLLERSLSHLLLTAAVKWVRGQKEHGGDIRDRDLRKELMDEAIDAYFYAVSLPKPSCPQELPDSGPSSS